MHEVTARRSTKKKRKKVTVYRPASAQDSVSQYLSLGIGLVLIAALLSAIFAFLFGIIQFNPAPQTIAEADIAQARKSVEVNQNAQSYADLIIAQAEDGNLVEAETLLNQANSLKLDVTRTQALLYAEGYLFALKGDKEKAATTYRAVMTALDEAYENEKNRGGDANWALAGGKPANYYSSALALFELSAGAKDWEAAKEQLDIFIEGNPRDAEALIERGKVNLQLDNTKAATKDFKAALRYVPDDLEALKGLEEAGGRND
jgi:tetratricopeptide (TPR) repeat protein